MSYKRNFDNNFRGSNFTFQYVPNFPPPPLPPPLLPPMRPMFPPLYPSGQIGELSDQEFVKSFENRMQTAVKKFKPTAGSITQIREQLKCIVTSVQDFERQLNDLRENQDELSEDDWNGRIKEMNMKRENMTKMLEKCAGSYMDMSRKLLAKRTAKRLRLKKLNEERMLAKKERMKQAEERSRKIDENLQKIKDDIIKAQKAEEAKLEADVVLREVRRRKLDAKKCLAKLEALARLRRARGSTAAGRGRPAPGREAAAFDTNIDKLKALWNQKLLIYEKEEAQLQTTLSVDASRGAHADAVAEGVSASLARWRQLLFGDSSATPQVDFQGDVQKFITVRSHWDQFLSEDGSPLPIGWVVPPVDP